MMMVDVVHITLLFTVVFTTPEGGSWGLYLYLDLSLKITYASQEKLATPPGSPSPALFVQWCGFFYVLQELDKPESAVRMDLGFFVLIRWED